MLYFIKIGGLQKCRCLIVFHDLMIRLSINDTQKGGASFTLFKNFKSKSEKLYFIYFC